MKIVKIILTSLVAVFILPSTTFAEGSTVLSPEITDEMFISRINSVNGKELIEIYNSSRMETEISEMSVSVFNSTVSQNSLPTAVFKFDEGYIDAEGFTLIKQDGLESDIPSAELSKNTDKSYGINHNYIVGASASSTISGGRIDLSINNEVSSICWGSWANSILSSVYCDSVTVVNDTAVAVSDLCKSNERCFNNPELNFGGYHKKFYQQYCKYLALSEISVGEQWVEVHNRSNIFITSKNLENCVLEIPNSDSNTPYQEYNLSQIGDVIDNEYFVIELPITKTFTKDLEKQNGRLVMIRDGDIQYSSVRYNSQRSGTSMALIGNEWKITYNVTRGSDNFYQQWQTCESGKIINEKTGNCINRPEEPTECAVGYFRNPETGRCKKIAVDEPLSECADGYFRNPTTNRCKKIEVDEGVKPCDDGWERNPETNRCRKIISNEPAMFAVEQLDSESKNIWSWAGGGGLLVAAGMVGWQFKPEIKRSVRKFSRNKEE